MTAFNTVRFRVKSGQEQEFLDAHERVQGWPGLLRAHIIKTGDDTYCLIAEWPDLEALANARPAMIATLDTFRHLLTEVGDGYGLTHAISGPVVKFLR